MTIYQWKVKESISCSVNRLYVSSLQYKPKEADPTACEGVDNQAKRTSSLLLCPLYRLPAEDVTQVKGIAFHLKRYRLKVGLPTFSFKKSPTSVPSHLGFG